MRGERQDAQEGGEQVLEPKEAWERVRLLGGPAWRAGMWARAFWAALVVGFGWGVCGMTVTTWLVYGLLESRLPEGKVHVVFAYACPVVFFGIILFMILGPVTDGPLALASEAKIAELMERADRAKQAGNAEVVPATAPHGRGSEIGPTG
jgi:hypothetical protein